MFDFRKSDLAIFCDVAWTSDSVSGNFDWSFGRKLLRIAYLWNGMARSVVRTKVCVFCWRTWRHGLKPGPNSLLHLLRKARCRARSDLQGDAQC